MARVHLLRQPVDLPARVAEDDGLRDRQRLVQVAQRVQLPLLQPPIVIFSTRTQTDVHWTR